MMNVTSMKIFPIRPVGILTLALSIVLITPGTTGAQLADKCKKEFDFAQPESLTLEWKQGSEQGAEILSDEVRTRKLRVLISDFGLKDTSGKNVSSSKVIKVVHESGELINGALQILLRVVHTPDVKPGIYTGRVTVRAEEPRANSCLISKQIKLTVPSPSSPVVTALGPVLLIDKLTLWAYKWLPLLNFDCDDCYLPLKNQVTGKTTPPEGGKRLGAVRKDTGGTGVVYATSSSAPLTDGTHGLWLDIKGLEEAGKYEGDIVLDPTAGDKAKVVLTVYAAHRPILPVIVIALGILLAMFTKIYVGVIRIKWRLREQEAGLGQRFKESQKQFEEAARSENYKSYSIVKVFEAARRNLRTEIDNLRPSSGLTLDENDTNYKSVVALLVTLKKHADDWGRFGDNLNRLQQELSKATGLPPAPISNGVRPTLLSLGDQLLSGKELTLDEFVKIQESILQRDKEAQLWFRYKERLNRDKKHLDFVEANLAKLNDVEKASVAPVRAALNTARLRLWEAGSEQEMSDIFGALGTFPSEEAKIYSLATAAATTSAEKAEAAIAADEHQPFFISPALLALSAFPPEPADDAEREKFYASAIMKWDVFLAFVAFVIALLTGLNEYYFGKPFGTFKDYSVLFVWAVGTKVFVDIVSVALSWLFSRAPIGPNFNTTRP
jgi:hypothetical protein